MVPEAWPYGGVRLPFLIQLKDLETAPATQIAVILSLGAASGNLMCPFCGPLRCALGVVGTTVGTLVCPLLGALGLGVVLRLCVHGDIVNRALSSSDSKSKSGLTTSARYASATCSVADGAVKVKRHARGRLLGVLSKRTMVADL